MNICIIGNNIVPVKWDKELPDKNIIVRIFPNLYSHPYNETFFQTEHHAILNGLYENDSTYDLSEDQKDSLKQFNKIKFMDVNPQNNLVKLADTFGFETFRHLARDQKFRNYLDEMEERFKGKISQEIRTILYYCFTFREDTIHSYRFGLLSKKLDNEKRFLNSLFLNHIAHD